LSTKISPICHKAFQANKKASDLPPLGESLFHYPPMSEKKLFFLLPIVLLVFACEKEYVPKPKGFNRIDPPVPAYQELKEDHPFTFDYSTQAKIVKDSSNLAEPHWINVYYPYFDANIQLTYKPLHHDKKKLEELIQDSYKLANKHQVKAYSIEETTIKTPSGLTATVIELTGDVPSPFQFFSTDSTDHFLRGALYFKSTQADSLAPAIEYMKKETMMLLNTLEWK
jgi:gliding motility-associated lipoprotein GldD